MAVIGLGCAKEAPQTPEAMAKWSDESLWSLEVVDIDGNTRSLSEFDGQVALVVNVASRCGFTPQYEELQALYDARRKDGFVILGFPCNDFGGQESGSTEEIKAFCTTRFGVEFPMFSKVAIKDDATRSPTFELLGTQTGKLPGLEFRQVPRRFRRQGDRVLQFNRFAIWKEDPDRHRRSSRRQPILTGTAIRLHFSRLTRSSASARIA